jgi:hypothetical protein
MTNASQCIHIQKQYIVHCKNMCFLICCLYLSTAKGINEKTQFVEEIVTLNLPHSDHFKVSQELK